MASSVKSRFRENPGITKYPKNEREWSAWIQEVSKWIADQQEFEDEQALLDTAQTDITTAEADILTNNVTVESLSQLEWSDSSSVWPGDSTTDHVLSFKRAGVEISTHTIRSAFTQSTGDFTVTSQAETGEATVETITGSGGRDAKGVVSHTGSGIIGKVTMQAIDQGVAGGSPSK